MRVAAKITITDEQRVTLQRWARGRTTPVRRMQRAQMILMAADGRQNKEIAETLGTQPSTVGRWRGRFAQSGLAGIEKDAPRGGRQPTKQRRWAQRIIETTLHQTPAPRDTLEHSDVGEVPGHSSQPGAARVEGA